MTLNKMMLFKELLYKVNSYSVQVLQKNEQQTLRFGNLPKSCFSWDILDVPIHVNYTETVLVSKRREFICLAFPSTLRNASLSPLPAALCFRWLCYHWFCAREAPAWVLSAQLPTSNLQYASFYQLIQIQIKFQLHYESMLRISTTIVCIASRWFS